MKIPPGKTEDEVIEAISEAVRILAPSYTFGSYGVEDLKQEGWIIAIKVLDDEVYDTSRSLKAFMYTHIRNRYSNLRRDLFRRSDHPCIGCHTGFPCSDAVGHWCEKYRLWAERNKSKANIASPICIDSIAEDRSGARDSEAESDAEISELLAKIDSRLPAELRATYLQMRAGVAVAKPRRLEVELAVKEILREDMGECPSQND